MDQRAILNLGKGDFAQGWAAVTAQVWVAPATVPMQMTGSLPAAPDLEMLYRRWQQLYRALYAYRGGRSPQIASSDFEIETDETYPTDVSEPAFKQLCHELSQALNHWLNSDGFRNIDRFLHTRFTPHDQIQVIIVSDNHQLLQLPWHLWQFFEDYPKAEPALSLPEYSQSLKTFLSTTQSTATILAVLGDSQGIDIQHDRQLLQQLPHTQLQFLIEPNLAELNQQLWQPSWDILFFAGHSFSQAQGCVQINPTDSLTLDQLRYGLRKAIERGLKLAIFNSCEGLGLAWDLADLQMPQVIVMREPVPDRVAQEFLKHFLTAFSDNQPIYLAVREAREKLQGLETEFFCASWLPVLCQNPAELPMRWEWGVGGWESGRVGEDSIAPSPHPSVPPSPRPLGLKLVLLASLMITACVFGLRSLGVLQPLELWAFDRLLQLRPIEQPDRRLLIVTIDETDIQAQGNQQRRGSLADQTLEQLLQRLERYQARVIGLDIYRDFPANAQYPGLINQLRQNQRLVAICKSSDAKFDPTGIPAPPEVPTARIGFSDFLEDPDGVLRRQLLFHTPAPASPCVTPYAFNARLALRYLQDEGITPEFTTEGNLKLGQTLFQPLQERTGGYQGIDARGGQVLLNYRSLPTLGDIAPQVSLTQVLQGKVRPEIVKDRIVLVGVTAVSSSDVWITPYGAETVDRIPGVIIQAHMTSQLMSAVLDGRSLIWVWHGMGEFLWIGLWALVGGISFWFRRSWLQWGIIGTGAISVLLGSCYFALIHAGWIPLIPAGIAFLITVGVIRYLNRTI
ncbi:MAG: CHASE2 domain-containing protein [Leptolyngbyaceae cyanobacterium bins.302]|nr:CHASE2 domain-containing protein [Leptolyngbyaceae cyanobacterium bins.302]